MKKEELNKLRQENAKELIKSINEKNENKKEKATRKFEEFLKGGESIGD